MPRCEHGWGGDDDCPDCLDEYIAEQDALSVLETRAEKAEVRVKSLEADVEHLQDEVNTLRAWLEWLTLNVAGFAVLGIVAFAFWCTYSR